MGIEQSPAESGRRGAASCPACGSRKLLICDSRLLNLFSLLLLRLPAECFVCRMRFPVPVIPLLVAAVRRMGRIPKIRVRMVVGAGSERPRRVERTASGGASLCRLVFDGDADVRARR